MTASDFKKEALNYGLKVKSVKKTHLDYECKFDLTFCMEMRDGNYSGEVSRIYHAENYNQLLGLVTTDYPFNAE